MPTTQQQHHTPPATPRPTGLVAVDGQTYPLESTGLEARAEGGIAWSSLTQTYRNPYDEPLEVLYTLPLPADGAVVGYAIHLGERVIRGEVRSREEAREEYRKALLEGHTAGLLEQDRADTFQQKLGCLPAGETACVEIEILQPLAFERAGGDEQYPRWAYRFPTVVGVRYQGEPGRVPDAGRLDVERAAARGALSDPALRRAIRECIEELPERPRRALRSRIRSGHALPDRNLASRLNMKLNTFLQNIVRARRLLKKCLEGKGVSLAGIVS